MKVPSILNSNTTAENWHERRAEILEMFSSQMYGYNDPIPNLKTSVALCEKYQLEKSVTKEIYRIFFENEKSSASLSFSLYLPQNCDKSLPVVMMINPFNKNPGIKSSNGDHNYKQLPYYEITNAGYCACMIYADDLSADNAKLFAQGILQLGNESSNSSWGAIGVWAWSASRVVDFIVNDNRFDKDKISVAGCSRAGKAALWCGAQDTRIAITISNVSGCGGASISRDKKGENIERITRVFPHWFCDNYRTYADNEDNMPFDQHMLLSLCAPRPVYVSSAAEDEWADPVNEHKSCIYASEVYEMLGKSGLENFDTPQENIPLHKGDIAYHIRSGAHGCTLQDWELFLIFIKKYFG